MRECGLDGLPFLLQASSPETTTCNTELSLSDKGLVIVSPVITIHTLRKKVRY